MSSEPGHSNPDHMKADGTPDMRFKEVSHIPYLPDSKETMLICKNGGGEHGNQGGRQTGFEEEGDGTSRLVTEGSGEEATYKPSAHDGKKQDGSDDKRESTG